MEIVAIAISCYTCMQDYIPCKLPIYAAQCLIGIIRHYSMLWHAPFLYVYKYMATVVESRFKVSNPYRI